MQEIDYITYNDLYGGIYQSQVIDVINTLNNNFEVNVKLKAFVPLKLWKSQAKIIKSHMPGAKVYPILGRVSDVSRTRMLLRKSDKFSISRGPLAFEMAKAKYGKIVYDGRAAVKAEVEEYDVAGSVEVGEMLIAAEKNAVESADACIAVSNQLVIYWKEELGLRFDESRVVKIPCTLSNYMKDVTDWGKHDEKLRVVYSGGTGPWQSFDHISELLKILLSEQSNVEVLFLTKDHPIIDELVERFPGRVERKWLGHDEVGKALRSCDYGVLIRNQSWTNRVASPVKFAEYLNAGLKVLISENLGDYSALVKSENIGLVIDDKINYLPIPSEEEKQFCHNYCKQNFTKNSEVIKSSYANLLNLISNG